MTDSDTKERLARLEIHAEYTRAGLSDLQETTGNTLKVLNKIDKGLAIEQTKVKRQTITISTIVAALVGFATRLIQ